MTELEEKVEKKTKKKPSEDAILTSLFTQVVKPSDVVKISCVNVYNNRYRINIWTSVPHAFMPKNGKISVSYFVTVDVDGSVTIISKN